MIFVTVGTHEQQFNRLIKEIDVLKEQGNINEEVFIQSGYSNYIPTHCRYSQMVNYQDMLKLTKEARIIITHGGPGSIMLPLSMNKVPIVVPRQAVFNEHVDNHQVFFTRRLEKEQKVLAVYEDIKLLSDTVKNYTNKISKLKIFHEESNLPIFVGKLDKVSKELISK